MGTKAVPAAPENDPDAAPSGAVKKEPKLQRLPRPDKAAVEAQAAVLKAQADRSRAREEEINALLAGRRSARAAGGGEEATLRRAHGELRNEFKARLAEKLALRAELAAAEAGRDVLRAEARDAKAKLQFVKHRVLAGGTAPPWACSRGAPSRTGTARSGAVGARDLAQLAAKARARPRGPSGSTSAQRGSPAPSGIASWETTSEHGDCVSSPRLSLVSPESLVSESKAAEIDAEVDKMESRLAHSSLPLAEEKRLIASIADLRRSKTFVADYGARLERLAGDEAACRALHERIRAKDGGINDVKARLDAAGAALDAQRAKAAEAASDAPALLAEKEECREVVVEAAAAARALWAAYKTAEDEFYARERLLHLARRETAQRQQAEWEAERARRAALKKERDAESAPAPYAAEIAAAESLAAHLAKHATPVATGEAAAAAAAAAAAEAAAAAAAAAPKGMLVMKKKGDGDGDLGWFGLSKGGKKGAGAGGGEKAKRDPVAIAAARGAERVTHSLDALQAYAKLGLTLPTTVADCAASLESVKAKLAHYTALQEAKIAAAAAGVKDPEPEVMEAPPPTADGGDEGEAGVEGEDTAETPAVDATAGDPAAAVDDDVVTVGHGGHGADADASPAPVDQGVPPGVDDATDSNVVPPSEVEDGPVADAAPASPAPVVVDTTPNVNTTEVQAPVKARDGGDDDPATDVIKPPAAEPTAEPVAESVEVPASDAPVAATAPSPKSAKKSKKSKKVDDGEGAVTNGHEEPEAKAAEPATKEADAVATDGPEGGSA